MRLNRAVSNDDGWMLIEVMMGAALMAALMIGLLSGFDGSSRAASINKQRSIAASLAQTDQERMRTYTSAHLSNLRATVPAAQTLVGGVQYTVKERADWINDDTGIANCTSSDTQGSYIEITSTVTWKGMGITKPVTAQSYVTPPVGSFGPGQGSIGIKLTDRDGDPVSSTPVSLGASYNDITDDNGCAVFGYIPSGNYVAQATRSGWVDVGGNQPAKQNCPAPDGSTAICSFTDGHPDVGDRQVLDLPLPPGDACRDQRPAGQLLAAQDDRPAARGAARRRPGRSRRRPARPWPRSAPA